MTLPLFPLFWIARFYLVLGWMQGLAPDRDVVPLAVAVALVAQDEVEASELTAIGFRESSLRNDVEGGGAVCAMQIQNGPQELRRDPMGCVSAGAAMLRESKRIDPENPIAFYAAGWNYRSPLARSISRDREAIAARLRQQK